MYYNFVFFPLVARVNFIHLFSSFSRRFSPGKHNGSFGIDMESFKTVYFVLWNISIIQHYDTICPLIGVNYFRLERSGRLPVWTVYLHDIRFVSRCIIYSVDVVK